MRLFHSAVGGVLGGGGAAVCTANEGITAALIAVPPVTLLFL